MSQSTAMDGFALYMRRCHLSPATIRRRAVVFNSLADYLDRDLLTVTPAEIEAWLDSRPRGPQTRRAYVNDVHALFAWAIREELAQANPTERVARPRVPKRLPRPVTDAQLTLALEQATPRLGAIIALCAYAGLRVQEVAWLRGEDVDEVSRTIIVTHGKGAKERIVPLHHVIVTRLHAHGLPQVGYVFTGPTGKPLQPVTVSCLVADHFRSRGIEATAHKLRAWFATTVYRQSGGDLRMTQDLLGHASPTTTSLYVAWCPTRAAAVVTGLRV